ncbi:hypothetical protein DND58_30765 [Pseudomonas syringae pv. pisi]|nr:hypothetical protein DND58_30765 [Pseudomonas syringae pv. pisi]
METMEVIVVVVVVVVFMPVQEETISMTKTMTTWITIEEKAALVAISSFDGYCVHIHVRRNHWLVIIVVERFLLPVVPQCLIRAALCLYNSDWKTIWYKRPYRGTIN